MNERRGNLKGKGGRLHEVRAKQNSDREGEKGKRRREEVLSGEKKSERRKDIKRKRKKDESRVMK